MIVTFDQVLDWAKAAAVECGCSGPLEINSFSAGYIAGALADVLNNNNGVKKRLRQSIAKPAEEYLKTKTGDRPLSEIEMAPGKDGAA